MMTESRAKPKAKRATRVSATRKPAAKTGKTAKAAPIPLDAPVTRATAHRGPAGRDGADVIPAAG